MTSYSQVSSVFDKSEQTDRSCPPENSLSKWGTKPVIFVYMQGEKRQKFCETIFDRDQIC